MRNQPRSWKKRAARMRPSATVSTIVKGRKLCVTVSRLPGLKRLAATLSVLLAASALCSTGQAQSIPQRRLAQARADQELLRNRLIDTGTGDAARALAAFTANGANFDAGHPWHVLIPARDAQGAWNGVTIHIRSQRHDYATNENDSKFALITRTTVIGQETTFSMTNDPVSAPGPLSFDVPTYGVTFSLEVPACSFDAREATCYPASSVSASLPTATLTVDQPGRASVTAGPGKQLRFDRSLGPTTLTMSEMQGFTFLPIAVSLRLNQGPDVEVRSNASHDARFVTYRRLADITAAIEKTERDTSDPDQGLKLKTLLTQARIISAHAVQMYTDAPKILLASRAQDLEMVDSQVFALHKLAFAGAALSPDDINLTLERIDTLLTNPNITDRDTLSAIRKELVRARDDIGATGQAIRLVESNLTSFLDAEIADFQTLLLECAQYADDGSLAAMISPTTKGTIATGFTSADVTISDEVLGGRGRAIRAAAGLPAP